MKTEKIDFKMVIPIEYFKEYTDAIKHYESSLKPNTRIAFHSDLSVYAQWCKKAGKHMFPVNELTVEMFVIEHARKGRTFQTVDRKIKALYRINQIVTGINEINRNQIANSFNTHKSKEGQIQSYTAPLTRDLLLKLPGLMDCSNAKNIRDFAIVLLTYKTMLRRSGIANLKVEELNLYSALSTPSHKRTPGMEEIHSLAVQSVHRWIEYAGINEGYLFRKIDKWGRIRSSGINSHTVGMAIKRVGHLIDASKTFTGQSIRIGAAIDMFSDGEPVNKIVVAGGWKNAISLFSALKHVHELEST